VELPTWLGVAPGLDEVALPAGMDEFDCRNNRLAWFGLQTDGFADAVHKARQRWGAHRVAVLLGTSTSGLLQTELAYRRRAPSGALPADFHYAQTQNTFSLGAFVVQALGLQGPSWVVSTACSSSAKVFGSAARLIEAGLVDAARGQSVPDHVVWLQCAGAAVT
jgi:3-oxoacyl-[acyl-carrier-protein] synthase-1